jgi:hypothetical protein
MTAASSQAVPSSMRVPPTVRGRIGGASLSGHPRARIGRLLRGPHSWRIEPLLLVGGRVLVPGYAACTHARTPRDVSVLGVGDPLYAAVERCRSSGRLSRANSPRCRPRLSRNWPRWFGVRIRRITSETARALEPIGCEGRSVWIVTLDVGRGRSCVVECASVASLSCSSHWVTRRQPSCGSPRSWSTGDLGPTAVRPCPGRGRGTS